MNRDSLERGRVNPGVEGVIESYELAFRMQAKLPDVMDLAGESAATKRLYGLDDPATAARFGRAGRQRVLDEFRWESIAARTAALYASLG